MSQKTFYTHLSDLKLPEIKTISTKIHNKGLIRKERENKIRLIDNNSIISHIFVRRKKLVRGSSLKLFKAKLQHRRDDFYTGNFLLATSKIRLKNAASNFLQKLQNMRRREKVASVPPTKIPLSLRLRLDKANLALKSSPRKISPESRRKLMKKVYSIAIRKIQNKEQKKVKSWFVNPISNETRRKRIILKRVIKFLPLELKKKAFQGKILLKKKQISSKKNKLRKMKRLSKKFPVMVTGPKLWAGGKAMGCGMRKFVPKSSFLLAEKRILSRFQKKTELNTENWQQLKRLKSVIPFRVLPAFLAKSVKITPLWFKHNYSQVSMKKWKKNRAIGTKGRKRNPISFKGVFIHTNKKLIWNKFPKVLPKLLQQKTIAKPAQVNQLPSKKLQYIKNENNAKSNKKTNRYFANKPNNEGANVLPVRSSDQQQKQQRKQIDNFPVHHETNHKRSWERRHGKKDTTIQSQQKPKPER